MRRRLTLAILGALLAGGAIAATPSLPDFSVPLPAGAVAQVTATPAAILEQPSPSLA